jgi:hypothetical protein
MFLGRNNCSQTNMSPRNSGPDEDGHQCSGDFESRWANKIIRDGLQKFQAVRGIFVRHGQSRRGDYRRFATRRISATRRKNVLPLRPDFCCFAPTSSAASSPSHPRGELNFGNGSAILRLDVTEPRRAAWVLPNLYDMRAARLVCELLHRLQASKNDSHSDNRFKAQT